MSHAQSQSKTSTSSTTGRHVSHSAADSAARESSDGCGCASLATSPLAKRASRVPTSLQAPARGFPRDDAAGARKPCAKTSRAHRRRERKLHICLDAYLSEDERRVAELVALVAGDRGVDDIDGSERRRQEGAEQ